MSNYDEPLDAGPGSLVDLVTADVLNMQRERCADVEPGAMGAFPFPPISAEIALNLVRAALDLAAQNYGDDVAGFILAHKDDIRLLIGPAVWTLADTIVHGMQDLKTSGT